MLDKGLGWKRHESGPICLSLSLCQVCSFFFSFEFFYLLVCVVNLHIHFVHSVQQRVDGVILGLDLRLETKSQVLQSFQAVRHVIYD